MNKREYLGPKDLLYKKVVDSSGRPIGKIVNLTQNGSGHFDLFGIEVYEEAAKSIGNGGDRSVSQLFLDVDIIGQVDKVIKLRKRLEELDSRTK